MNPEHIISVEMIHVQIYSQTHGGWYVWYGD